MQYTLRGIPKAVDTELRRRARRQRKSLNQVVIETLAEATGVPAEPIVRRDLSVVAGSWVEDPEAELLFEEMRRIDPADWR
jgi:hypothetical protein